MIRGDRVRSKEAIGEEESKDAANENPNCNSIRNFDLCRECLLLLFLINPPSLSRCPILDLYFGPAVSGGSANFNEKEPLLDELRDWPFGSYVVRDFAHGCHQDGTLEGQKVGRY